MKKTNSSHSQLASKKTLTALALVASFTAKIGAGTSSSWGNYQPILPKNLKR